MDAVKSPEYDDVRVVDLRPVTGMISGSAAKIMSLSALVLGIWSMWSNTNSNKVTEVTGSIHWQ
jgi:hypothetical protein